MTENMKRHLASEDKTLCWGWVDCINAGTAVSLPQLCFMDALNNLISALITFKLDLN